MKNIIGEQRIREEKRLLTNAEKEVIYQAFQKNNNRKSYIIWFVIIMIPMTALSFIYYVMNGIRGFVICFFAGCILAISIFVWADRTMKKLITKINSDELYVREAIFDSINKYHQATFYILKKGRLELYFTKADIKNRISVGDKVILIDRKNMVWVYKALD